MKSRTSMTTLIRPGFGAPAKRTGPQTSTLVQGSTQANKAERCEIDGVDAVGTTEAPAGRADQGRYSDQFTRGTTTSAAISPQRNVDDIAFDVLRGAVVAKDAAARTELCAWVKDVGVRTDRGEKFTVLEHTAIMYLLKSGFLGDGAMGQETVPTLHRALQHSWKQLTGKDDGKCGDQLFERLPKSVLMDASRKSRLFHAAAFLPIDDLKAQKEASSLLRDFVPEKSDYFVATAILTAAAFSSVACQVLATQVVAYGVIGFSEAFQHHHLAHPSKGTIGGWILAEPRAEASWIERSLHAAAKKTLGAKVLETKCSHQMVHHGMTFRDAYTKMFLSPEHQAKVDAFIDKLPKEMAEKIRAEEYGSKLSPEGLVRIMGAIGPQIAALVVGAAAFGVSPWAYVPIMLTAAMFPFTMNNVHPFLHIDASEAREKAGPLMKVVLNSRWAAWACRNHELHHRYNANYNLSFPGADALLGSLLQPNLKDLFHMDAEGALYH